MLIKLQVSFQAFLLQTDAACRFLAEILRGQDAPVKQAQGQAVHNRLAGEFQQVEPQGRAAAERLTAGLMWFAP